MCMRHRDYIFDRSTSRKSRLIPSDYMRRLTEALDSLPEAEDAENETKVRVIEHSYNKSFAAIISAAAVCILAVTGGFLASRPSEIISGGPGHKPADVPVTSSEKHDEVKPLITESAVTSNTSVTSAPAVTTLTVSVTQKTGIVSVTDAVHVTTVVSDQKVPDISVPAAVQENNDHHIDIQPEKTESAPQEPTKEERPVSPVETEPQKPEDQKPEDQKPENQKPENRPTPEKPDPDKDKEKPEAPAPEDKDRNPGENPAAPPVKAHEDEIEFFRPDSVLAPERPVHEREMIGEHAVCHSDEHEHPDDIMTAENGTEMK